MVLKWVLWNQTQTNYFPIRLLSQSQAEVKLNPKDRVLLTLEWKSPFYASHVLAKTQLSNGSQSALRNEKCGSSVVWYLRDVFLGMVSLPNGFRQVFKTTWQHTWNKVIFTRSVSRTWVWRCFQRKRANRLQRYSIVDLLITFFYFFMSSFHFRLEKRVSWRHSEDSLPRWSHWDPLRHGTGSG